MIDGVFGYVSHWRPFIVDLTPGMLCVGSDVVTVKLCASGFDNLHEWISGC